MNYDKEINELSAAVKADKSIINPWRNKAAARLEEALAFIRMGKSVTPAYRENQANCICASGAPMSACPVHGGS